MDARETETGYRGTGHTAKLVFLPSRYYKPKDAWTDEDWKEDWAEHVRHRRSVKNYRTWQEGRDRTLESQDRLWEDFEGRQKKVYCWFWILIFSLSFLGMALLLTLCARLLPVVHPVCL